MEAAGVARILDGKATADLSLRRSAAEASRILEALGRPPGLGVVLVGDDPASRLYVKMKTKAAEKIGVATRLIELPAGTTAERLGKTLRDLNYAQEIDGILLQLPLPSPLQAEAHIEQIFPSKDVDGFHPMNVGRSAAGCPAFEPCTPLGIRELLLAHEIRTRGRRAVVLGRGLIVGLPMSRMLMAKGIGGDATVTVCHSRTVDLADHVRQADIVIAAAGKANLVTGAMLKPGAVVVDVGVNRVEDPTAPKGYRVVGDVEFESASKVAGWISPVPGGVGPMTVAMLMQNTIKAAKQTLAAQQTIRPY